MGHNVSDRKLAERRAKEVENLPPGWRRVGKEAQAVNTPRAMLARGAVVVGRCSLAPECGRRVRPNLRFLVDHGFGDAEISRLQSAYSCGRYGGCELRFDQPMYPNGAPLLSLLQTGPMAVEFRCAACDGMGWQFTPERLLARVTASGRGDGNTGLSTLAAAIRKRCQCGGREWRARLRWPPPSGGDRS